MTAAKTLPRAVVALLVTLSVALFAAWAPVAMADELPAAPEAPVVVEETSAEATEPLEGEATLDAQGEEPVAAAADSTASETPAADATATTEDAPAEQVVVDAEDETVDDAGSAEAEPVALAAEDALAFLYVDLAQIEVGETQHLVVALADESATMPADAVLALLGPSGETIELLAEDASGTGALFVLDVDAAGTYELVSLAYALDGVQYVVDLAPVADEVRFFEAVEAAEEPAEDLDVDDLVDVYIMDDEGSVTEVGSVEEAVAVVSPMRLMANSGSSTVSRLKNLRTETLTIAIDPGHDHMASGAGDPGAVRYEDGTAVDNEARMTWRIANACLTELANNHPDVNAFLVCNWDEGAYNGVTIRERANRAIAAGADVYVSIHINTAGASSANGCEVWCPSGVVQKDAIYKEGSELGTAILRQLTALTINGDSLANRGLHYGNPSGQPNDSLGDYFGNIRYTRAAGIPGIIVEHAFLSNYDDYNNFLKSNSSLNKLGVADATGIANYYDLYTPTESDFALVYDYTYYINNNPDVKAAYGSNRTGAFQHFLRYGIREGRQAIATFNVNSYRNEYADLRALYGDNMLNYYVHWSLYGSKEGRHGTGCTQVKDWGDTSAMHRLYNKWTGEHFYTASVSERNSLIMAGWTYEGTGWYAPNVSGTPVYRLYNKWVAGGDHHYTTSLAEVETLVAAGWTNEGVAWYSAEAASALPVLRQYNPWAKSGAHNFTTSTSENNHLVSVGWKAEGTAWYATAAGSSSDNGGSPVPENVYVVDPGGQTPILGAPMVTQDAIYRDFVSRLAYTPGGYPTSVYKSRGAATPKAFIAALWNAAISENVRPEVLYAQVIIETGCLRFGGLVSAEQCNFGGLGAADDGSSTTATFDTVQVGLTAQAQHLRCYAGYAPLTPCVDPRYGTWLFGRAVYVEQLGGKNALGQVVWASDPTYASKLLTVMRELV